MEVEDKIREVIWGIFTTEPILVVSDLNKKIRIEVDMFNYMTGGVLLMECIDRRWKPVVYLSKLWDRI